MRILFIILSVFVFAGCARKIVPPAPTVTIVTKDSTIIKEKIVYRNDTIKLAGDTTEIWASVPCPDAKFDKTITKGRTTLTVKMLNGLLRANCTTDSINHIVDSLKNVLRETDHFNSERKTTVVHDVVTVTKYKVPKWCWWLIGVNVLVVGLRIYTHKFF